MLLFRVLERDLDGRDEVVDAQLQVGSFALDRLVEFARAHLLEVFEVE